MLKRNCVFALVLLMIGASASFAQSTPASLTLRMPDRGFSSYTTLSQSYDSSANWTSIIDSTVSYKFNRVFGISLGAPFYLAYNQPIFTSTTTQIGGTTTQFKPTSGYTNISYVRFLLNLATTITIIMYVA